MIWILSLLLILAAALILCGYTTLRLPVRRREARRHIACVGDSVTLYYRVAACSRTIRLCATLQGMLWIGIILLPHRRFRKGSDHSPLQIC